MRIINLESVYIIIKSDYCYLNNNIIVIFVTDFFTIRIIRFYHSSRGGFENEIS